MVKNNFPVENIIINERDLALRNTPKWKLNFFHLKHETAFAKGKSHSQTNEKSKKRKDVDATSLNQLLRWELHPPRGESSHSWRRFRQSGGKGRVVEYNHAAYSCIPECTRPYICRCEWLRAYIEFFFDWLFFYDPKFIHIVQCLMESLVFVGWERKSQIEKAARWMFNKLRLNEFVLSIIWFSRENKVTLATWFHFIHT